VSDGYLLVVVVSFFFLFTAFSFTNTRAHTHTHRLFLLLIGWPNDPKTGLPIGGQDLKDAELSRISKQNAMIGDAALDAVFDSWAWGASVATPDKVDTTLNLYRPSGQEVDLNAFVSAAIRGRSATGFAAASFVLIQIVAFGVLFIAPALRFFFNVDIGFGTMGA